MTSAESNAPATTLAEDKGPRESVIRDLYAIVAFYVANPDFPLPVQISVHCVAPTPVVEAIAAERGTRVYGDIAQTDFRIEGTARPVTVLVCAPRQDRPL